MNLLERASWEREKFEEDLRHRFRREQSKDAKFALAFLMGRMRTARCVGALNEQIALEAELPQRQTKERAYWQYPAAEALIEIGGPTVPVMLENLAGSDDVIVRKLSLRVMRAVDGPHIARMRLERTAAEATDPRAKQRLSEAVSSLAQQTK